MQQWWNPAIPPRRTMTQQDMFPTRNGYRWYRPEKTPLVLFSLLSFKSTVTGILEWWGEDSLDEYSFTGDHGSIFLTAVPGPDVCMPDIMHHKWSLFFLPLIKKCWKVSKIWLCNFFSKCSTFLQCLNSLCRQADTLWCGLFVYFFFTLMPILKWPLLVLHLLWSYDSFLAHFMVLSFCGYIFSDSHSCCFLCFLILSILSADIISGAICASQALQWGHR